MSKNYIENPFKEGDFVKCINDYFPVLITTKEDKSEIGSIPELKPKKDEILCIDEILGEYIRFDLYDGPTSYNWWLHTHFIKVTLEECETYFEKIGEEFIDFVKDFQSNPK